MSDIRARLLHPAYIVPALPAGCMILDHDQVRADMRDAAAEIARLQEAKRHFSALADAKGKENVDLRQENERLREAIEAIKQATIAGRVCDDVAWFDTITTLHDYCDQTLNPGRAAEQT